MRGGIKMECTLNKVFTTEKGNRKRRWKVIINPWFENSFSLVGDYSGMRPGEATEMDYSHIVHSSMTIEKIISSAYDHT